MSKTNSFTNCQNFGERFPENDKNIISAFAVLGLKPLGFLNREEVAQWGNDKLETLIEQFGKEKVRGDVVSPPIIEPEEVRLEWSSLKTLVVSEGYPRSSMGKLWNCIITYHRDAFPNMIKLAQVALTAPIHTCDCERGFSLQNRSKTSLRNRLGSERLKQLMTIVLEGPEMEKMNFRKDLLVWKNMCQRKIFNR